VTHIEYMERFPECYAKEEWAGKEIDYFGASKGNGVVLDLIHRTFEHIRHSQP
jgi:hypothetical protein